MYGFLGIFVGIVLGYLVISFLCRAVFLNYFRGKKNDGVPAAEKPKGS